MRFVPRLSEGLAPCSCSRVCVCALVGVVLYSGGGSCGGSCSCSFDVGVMQLQF